MFLLKHVIIDLQHVASNIVEHEIRHKEILQSSFDLLGELVKFNIEAFKTFDNIFTTQQKVSILKLVSPHSLMGVFPVWLID